MQSVNDIYLARVAAGELTEDAAQLAAIVEFDRILTQLAQPVKSSWFRKARPEAVTGFYL